MDLVIEQQQVSPLYNALVGISRGEWQAFVDGITFSTNLLIALLTYKYRKQKSIVVSQDPINLGEDESLTLPNRLSRCSVVEYELSVVVYPSKVGGGPPITGLLVRKQQYPFILFTVPSKREKNNSRDTPKLSYAVDARYAYPRDNAYFVFDYLQQVSEDLSSSSPSQRERGALIIAQLERPQLIKDQLVKLYGELNDLVNQSDFRNKETLRAVENTKQFFYRWVERALDRSISTIENGGQAMRFLEMRAMFNKDDPIATKAATSDDLFKRLIGLIDFLELVVATSHSKTPSLKIEGRRDASLADVKEHIRHLRYRILNHVDELNVPFIDTVMSYQLGFTQREYERMLNTNFIHYNLIAAVLNRGDLDSEILLLGPQQALFSKQELRKVSSSRIILWVLEGATQTEDPYYGLLVLEQPLLGLPRRTVYLPSKQEDESIVFITQVESVLEKIGLRPLYSQIDSDYNIVTPSYHVTTWYTMHLIKKLMLLPVESNWVDQVRSILFSTSSAELFESVEVFMHQARQMILKLLFPPEVLPVIVGVDNESVPIESKLSDIARLRIKSQYIDDAVIHDIVRSMKLKSRCHTFDPVFWAGSLQQSYLSQVSLKQLKVFTNLKVEMLLLPINEGNEHWALAVIDLTSNAISFYSSILSDSYYTSDFKPIISYFLASQTPGVQYTITYLKGQEVQPQGSVDCALYVLNKMSQLCVKEEDRVLYNRASVAAYLGNQLSLKVKRREWVYFVEDFCLNYFFLEDTLRDILDDVQIYRKYYIDELRSILFLTNLYSEKTILLFITSIEGLDYCEEIDKLFDDILVPEVTLSTKSRKRKNDK